MILFFKLIAVFLKGTVFFVLLGLIVVVGGAMMSAFLDAELEDGTTMRDTFIEAGQELDKAYGPCFDDVDVKHELKERAKELEQVGRETVTLVKRKSEPITTNPEVVSKFKEAQRLIEEYERNNH